MPASLDHHIDARILVRSPYTTAFAHMGEVYVYHDLFGYILKMSPDLLGLLDGFSEPRLRDDVCKEFSNAFGDQTPETFVGTFIQFSCLIRKDFNQIEDIWGFFPVKGAWNVWSRDKDGAVTIYAGWGDRPVERHKLTVDETAIWDAIDGNKTTSDLAETFDRDAIKALVARLAHHTVQALKLSATPMNIFKGSYQHMKPPYLTSTMPYKVYDPKVDPLPTPLEDLFSTDGYYAGEVADADEQFDHQETTLSHLFRVPHPALRQRTYGQAFIDALRKRGYVPDDAVKILEVGGGLGYVARDVTKALIERGYDVTYHILELCPPLAEAQRERTAGLPVEVFAGDCLKADFPASDYDLVIANEMIGDLTAGRLTHAQLGMDEDGIDDDKFEAGLDASGVIGEIVRRHKVPIADGPDPMYLNVGAWQLVERLWDIIKPGGGAVLTEFGEMARYPVVSTQLDHPEISIHFGQLTLVARSVGFETEFEFLMDLIDMNRDMKGFTTTRSYFRALQAVLADHDITLEKIGYTKGMLQGLIGDKLRVGKTLGDIAFDRLEDRLMGLVPHEFKALLLKKPAS